jgi:hypothetical protein
MSTYLDEREIVGNIFASSWTACPVAYPDQDFETPSPTNDPTSPASFIYFDISYNDTDLIAMGGASQVEGQVEVSIWVEKDFGDYLLRSHIETLRTLFKTADSPEQLMWFLEPQPLNFDTMPGWYGRVVSIPFLRIRT